MKPDEAKVLSSLSKFKNQCQDAWVSASRLKIKQQKIKNIVVAGMGGSALGGHIIRSVFGDFLKSPFVIVNSYSLPEFVNKDTLVILSSYSGNTEEVLSCLKDAKKRKARMVALTGGGLLEKHAKQNKIPVVVFDTKHNPSGEPRLGIGYSIFGILGILKRTGILKIKGYPKTPHITCSCNFRDSVTYERRGSSCKLCAGAKKIAKKLHGKIPVIVGSEFLVGNLHTFQNQLHESSKNFACYFELPELNHHLMEGLVNPKSNKKNLLFFFFESNLYHSRNKKRCLITKEVIKKNKIDFINYKLKSKDKLSQSLEFLLLGSFISFYLTILNKANPITIPWVDYFKRRLR